jgi:hypothetical protein
LSDSLPFSNTKLLFDSRASDDFGLPFKPQAGALWCPATG